jgi:putative membrane protein
MPHPRTLLANVGRGLLMGGADVIPGVSGGTVALVLGIYERLIRSVGEAASAGFLIVRLDPSGARSRLRDVEWGLVVPLGLGIITAIVIGSRVIPGLIEEYPVQVSAVFFGLILGSIAIPFRRIERVGPLEVALIVGFAVGAFILVGLPPREIVDPPLSLVFPAAAIAICAMILPGVSGAFLLLAMGLYRPTLDALSRLDIAYVATFIAGAALGLALFSKILEWLLQHRHASTMAALTGLMAGSLRALWPWLDEDRDLLAPPDGGALAVAVALGAAAFAFVSVVAWIVRRTEGSEDASR